MHGYLLQRDYHRRWRNANSLLASAPFWKSPNLSSSPMGHANARQVKAVCRLVRLSAGLSAWFRTSSASDACHTKDDDACQEEDMLRPANPLQFECKLWTPKPKKLE